MPNRSRVVLERATIGEIDQVAPPSRVDEQAHFPGSEVGAHLEEEGKDHAEHHHDHDEDAERFREAVTVTKHAAMVSPVRSVPSMV